MAILHRRHTVITLYRFLGKNIVHANVTTHAYIHLYNINI